MNILEELNRRIEGLEKTTTTRREFWNSGFPLRYDSLLKVSPSWSHDEFNLKFYRAVRDELGHLQP
jgi:hypothetical protein